MYPTNEHPYGSRKFWQNLEASTLCLSWSMLRFLEMGHGHTAIIMFESKKLLNILTEVVSWQNPEHSTNVFSLTWITP